MDYLKSNVASVPHFLGRRKRIQDNSDVQEDTKKNTEVHSLSDKIMIYEVQNTNSAYAGEALDLYVELIKETSLTFRSLDSDDEEFSLSESIVDTLIMAMPNVKFIRINNSDWNELSVSEAAEITCAIFRNGRIKLMTLSSGEKEEAHHEYDVLTNGDEEEYGDSFQDLESGNNNLGSSNDSRNDEPVIFDYRSYTPR